MKRWWVTGAMLAGGLAMAAEPITATVKGERVNVRARPHPQAEVVGQLSEPATIQVRSMTNDWLEIIPPAEFDLWVHREFVENGNVTASKLVVRAGPGINYPKVGELKRGDSVQVRGEFGEWLKIAPPADASLWISKSVVRLPEPPKPPVVVAARPPLSSASGVPSGPPVATGRPPVAVAPPAAPLAVPASTPPTPVPPPVVAVPPPPPTPPPYVPEDLRLAPVEHQGAVVQREGRVRATMLTLGRPSRYQLVDETGGVPETSCYLRGNVAQLRSFLDRRLRIRGRQYWVQGSRYPVVVVDQIAVLPD